jgi:uncharacterized membrane protein
MLANLLSGYGALDIVLGSLTTLISAVVTWGIGKALKQNFLSAILGGIPPVLFNAIVIPFVIILASPDESLSVYWVYFAQMLITQSVWVYGLGIPMYFGIRKMRSRGDRYLN